MDECATLENTFDYRLFFELSADLFCIAGYDGYFKKVNEAVCSLLGYTSGELMAVPIQTFVFDDDKRLTEENRQSLRTGNALMNFENRYRCKNGEVVWLAWTSIPVPEINVVYAVAKNITHIKTQEEDRCSVIKNLSTINDGLSLLAYTTSHDLRAPVNNLIGVFKLLNLSHIEDKETLEYIQLLNVVTDNLTCTLNNYNSLLNEINIGKVETELLSFRESFDRVQQSLSSLIRNTNTHINTSFSIETVQFNKSYLESIFLNLLTNSIKYTKPGEAPDISVCTSSANDRVHLIFSDNGIGFEMDEVKGKIFEFGKKFTDNADSKGVGLYLVNHHLKSLGGSIEVESNVNNGTTFIVSFPMYEHRRLPADRQPEQTF